jgi:superfamily II DNA or RNA helicase
MASNNVIPLKRALPGALFAMPGTSDSGGQAFHTLPQDHRLVAGAISLLWKAATLTRVHVLLRYIQTSRSYGSQVSSLMNIVNDLRQRGFIQSDYTTHTEERWEVRAEYDGLAYLDAITETPPAQLKRALQTLVGEYRHWSAPELELQAAIVRLAIFSGSTMDELETLTRHMDRSGRTDANTLYGLALEGGLHVALLTRIAPDTFLRLVPQRLRAANALKGPLDEASLQALLQLAPQASKDTYGTFKELSEHFLHLERPAEALQAVAALPEAQQQFYAAAAAVQRQDWAAASVAYDASLGQALKTRTKVPVGGMVYHFLLSQIAQGTPSAWLAAQQFCFDQLGSSSYDASTGIGLWAHALDVKLGKPVFRSAFELTSSADALHLDDAWRVLLRAWLGRGKLPADTLPLQVDAVVKLLCEALHEDGRVWLAKQVETAHRVWRGDVPPANFYCQQDPHSWQTLLTNLMALTEGSTAVVAPAIVEEGRILWELALDDAGAVMGLQALYQKRGARGNWNKPKSVSFAKLEDHPGLTARDHDIRKLTVKASTPRSYYQEELQLDIHRAVRALVGHPHVVIKGVSAEPITLNQGEPHVVETLIPGYSILTVVPGLRPTTHTYGLGQDVKSLERMTVLADPENPQTYQLIELKGEYLRAAELLRNRVPVPESARPTLDNVLAKLDVKLNVQADRLPAEEEVEASMHLRAELSPTALGIGLRLMVAPLGTKGPRYLAGQGKQRIRIKLEGKTTGTTRDLQAELARVDQLLNLLPCLHDAFMVEDEWQVQNPEHGLEMVETLAAHPELVTMDWPKGKSVRTVKVDARALNLNISTERDWLQLVGSVQVDEAHVLSLQELLATAGSARYVPLGDGVYAALTEDLRAKVKALAAVAESGKADTVKIPALAASWLEQAVEGADVTTDHAFVEKVQRLSQGQTSKPELPAELQATLWPYQVEGFEWLMRLAGAGFGACLADDMGLGKTLQTIAALLARAEQGAALVVAPTSVCGNWVDELQRFAPSLKVTLFGDGDNRPAQLAAVANLAAYDVVVVSYALLQRASETFTAKAWTTAVFDEAQAIKNLEAQRTQVAHDLNASFRIALTGTPVENHLSELWSIMHFCNPGLLSSLKKFKARFAVPIEVDGDTETQETLRRLVSPFLLRRTKDQVLPDLPELTEVTTHVTPTAHEAAYYEALRRRAIEQALRAKEELGPQQASIKVLAQLTTLRQAACDPRLVTAGEPAGAKATTFRELAKELAENGHRTLVFSQFVDHLELLKEVLDQEGLTYKYLVGKTPAAQRRKDIAAFQAGEGQFYLISLKAGGSGLNLTKADYVVLADPWWNPAVEDQAASRAHRMGQEKPVTVYRLISQGTVEEKILALHGKKRALSDGVLPGSDKAAAIDTDYYLSLMQ